MGTFLTCKSISDNVGSITCWWRHGSLAWRKIDNTSIAQHGKLAFLYVRCNDHSRWPRWLSQFWTVSADIAMRRLGETKRASVVSFLMTCCAFPLPCYKNLEPIRIIVGGRMKEVALHQEKEINRWDRKTISKLNTFGSQGWVIRFSLVTWTVEYHFDFGIVYLPRYLGRYAIVGLDLTL